MAAARHPWLRFALPLAVIVGVAIWELKFRERSIPPAPDAAKVTASPPPLPTPDPAPLAPPPAATPTATAASAPPQAATAPAPAAAPATMPPVAPVENAGDLPAVELPGNPREDLDNLSFTLRDYRTSHRENPVGNNAEITRALLGDNPRQLKLDVPAGSRLNADGELCDRWGSAYFFHQLSKTEMEIRSAGPDKTMWTDDDVVVK